MAREPAGRTDPVQDEIDRRRNESEKRFLQLIDDPSAAPAFQFTGEHPVEIEAAVHGAERGTMFVSFHTRAYFLLLLLLGQRAIRCTAITTPGIAEKFEARRFLAPDNIRFSATLNHNEVKRCLREKSALFIMADVLIDYASNAPVPILGRALRYTLSWAELATRMKLNVVVGLVKDHGETADVFLKTLGVPRGDAFDLACEVCGVFERYIDGETDLWENHPALEAYGYVMPDCRSGMNADLAATLSRLAICDKTVSQALREGMSG